MHVLYVRSLKVNHYGESDGGWGLGVGGGGGGGGEVTPCIL